jgi:N-acetylglucosaminyl-diphospho-decaprenol L-rhamnosyltransferase
MYGGHWRAWIARGLALGLGSPADLEPNVELVERQLDFVSGAAMLVSRAYIEHVGLMDEGYFLYSEEVDWCFRRRHFRLGYCHASIVYHDHGVTTGASMSRRTMSPLTVYLEERNKLILVRKFYPGQFPATALICLLLTSQYLTAGAVRNFFVALRGWWAGVRGQQGAPAGFFNR